MQRIIHGQLGIAPSEPLPKDDRYTSFFLISDDADLDGEPFFAKCPIIVDQGIFKYRLSIVRRVLENAITIILANSFGCLWTKELQEKVRQQVGEE